MKWIEVQREDQATRLWLDLPELTIELTKRTIDLVPGDPVLRPSTSWQLDAPGVDLRSIWLGTGIGEDEAKALAIKKVRGRILRLAGGIAHAE